ncbi:Saccharopine dehydrogenase [Labilithrix luteola]|uniref:Saccharopine dehydrogenase n=1 Tax=Labilithrix luteola TaxID=1391654 RepID=A0A0K1Q4F8_9BACT|nr:NAD(P)-dependent oxidoreductase [Labilithrix luteola]AKV00547.1 Saccharopine dehydrogenase [Labilithrix luteola]
MASTLKPVLVLGGSGFVGTRAIAALRRLQPDLPITIGARDLERASVVAKQTTLTNAVKVDLERTSLGLPEGAAYSGVVTLLKDDTLNSMKYAQTHGVPYVAFSDYLFEIAPQVALYAQNPAKAPILFLGHVFGGAAVLAALHFARQFRTVERVAIAAIIHEDDHGGPTTQTDVERGARVARPLRRENGQWVWASTDIERPLTMSDGTTIQVRAYPVLDVASVAAATGARSVRFDLGVRSAVGLGRERSPAVEMIFEISGIDTAGSSRSVRHEITDDQNLSTVSAHGLAIAVERLLGLDGGPAVPAGLYNPDTLLDPTRAVEKLTQFGSRIALDVVR